jgi:hypothetical protein
MMGILEYFEFSASSGINFLKLVCIKRSVRHLLPDAFHLPPAVPHLPPDAFLWPSACIF